jgi:hypothetical protein
VTTAENTKTIQVRARDIKPGHTVVFDGAALEVDFTASGNGRVKLFWVNDGVAETKPADLAYEEKVDLVLTAEWAKDHDTVKRLLAEDEAKVTNIRADQIHAGMFIHVYGGTADYVDTVGKFKDGAVRIDWVTAAQRKPVFLKGSDKVELVTRKPNYFTRRRHDPAEFAPAQVASTTAPTREPQGAPTHFAGRRPDGNRFPGYGLEYDIAEALGGDWDTATRGAEAVMGVLREHGLID